MDASGVDKVVKTSSCNNPTTIRPSKPVKTNSYEEHSVTSTCIPGERCLEMDPRGGESEDLVTLKGMEHSHHFCLYVEDSTNVQQYKACVPAAALPAVCCFSATSSSLTS